MIQIKPTKGLSLSYLTQLNLPSIFTEVVDSPSLLIEIQPKEYIYIRYFKDNFTLHSIRGY